VRTGHAAQSHFLRLAFTHPFRFDHARDPQIARGLIFRTLCNAG